jgi:type I restriction enzyme S subunit
MKTGISDSGLNLTHGRFVELPVPVPPLDEQRRIVELVEDQLFRLDAAQQGVRSGLRRSSALRDVALSTAVAEANKSPGVLVESLGALAKVSSGLTPLKGNRAFYDDGTIPWITSGDLHQGLITRPTQFVTQEALDSTTLKIVPSGTLLIAMYGEGKTRGTTAELVIDATTNQACAAVALHDDGLRPWVRLVLDANYSTLRRRAAGGVQPNLNLSLIKAIRIPVPRPEVREELLARRSELEEAQSRLQTQLDAAHRRGVSLRRSLLAAIFSGQLTFAPSAA